MLLSPGSAGSRILVVEDEAMIAFNLAQELEKAGFVVVGPAPSVAKALALIERQGCDFAVVDIHLRQETAEPIGRELLARGVPFVITTGYTNEQLPPIFHDVPMFAKPIQMTRLLAELRRRLQ